MDKREEPSQHEGSEGKGITRREFLSRIWWVVGGLLVIEAIGAAIGSLWPKLKQGTSGSKVSTITLNDARAMPVGTVTYFEQQGFYLSRLESGLIAIDHTCTHLGCIVPWLPDEPSEDNLAPKGRFNCPCHSAIFDRYGLVHAGPAPRPLDLFPISIDGGELVVDTGTIIKRDHFDESQVTKV